MRRGLLWRETISIMHGSKVLKTVTDAIEKRLKER